MIATRGIMYRKITVDLGEIVVQITTHGFALNVSPNMDHYNFIVPCGLAGSSVISMQQILGEKCPSMEETKKIVSDKFRGAIAAQAQVQKEPHQ